MQIFCLIRRFVSECRPGTQSFGPNAAERWPARWTHASRILSCKYTQHTVYGRQAKLTFKLLERLNALSNPVVQNISIEPPRGRGSDAFQLFFAISLAGNRVYI